MQEVIFRDLGKMEYAQAWDYQEALLQDNVRIKTEARKLAETLVSTPDGRETAFPATGTTNYLLFVEHPPVYTLGKSGHVENMLIGEEQVQAKGVQFFRSNRGGDITF